MSDDLTKKKLCFVVSAIGSETSPERTHADWVLQGVVEPVLAQFPDFVVKRADQMDQPGLIDSQVINALLDAELVVADLSILNANVFYEIGIRHMVQKPMVHMFKRGVTLPFDVSLVRGVDFSLERPRDVEEAKIRLKEFVKSALEPNNKPENPVTKARGRFALEQSATPPQRVIMETLESLGRRVSQVERFTKEQAPARRFFGGEQIPQGTLWSEGWVIRIQNLGRLQAEAIAEQLNGVHGLWMSELSGTAVTFTHLGEITTGFREHVEHTVRAIAPNSVIEFQEFR